MDKYGRGFKAWVWMVSLVAGLMVGCGSGDDGIFGGPGGGGGPGPAGPGPDLGVAATFGIASTAGVSNTGATTINGDVVLAAPTPQCNAVAAPGGAGTAGFGLCGGAPPTLNGTVVTPTSPDVTTANNVKNAMNTAFLGITPPAGPPAAGSRGAGSQGR